MKQVSVLFVCLGNICRSPTAHGIFRNLVEREGLSDRIRVESAGTSGWHIGEPPDKRTMAAAKARGYDLSDLRGRAFEASDFAEFDYILAMDGDNFSVMQRMQPSHYQGYFGLFLEFSTQTQYREVPDPYYGGSQGFETVLTLVEDACTGLLEYIKKHSL